MDSVVTLDQQEDMGILALAALRWVLDKRADASSTTVCGAVAHMVPHMSESSIRTLMYEVEGALHSSHGDHPAWVELMTVLRRVDRP